MQIGAYYFTNVAGSAEYPIAMTVDGNGNMVIGTLYDKNANGFSWVLMPAPGAEGEHGFYMQHFRTSKYAFWNWPDGGMLSTGTKFNGFDPAYYFRLDYTNQGISVVNNWNRKYVFDAAGDYPGNGSVVSGKTWNGGANQQWRLQFVSLFKSEE